MTAVIGVSEVYVIKETIKLKYILYLDSSFPPKPEAKSFFDFVLNVLVNLILGTATDKLHLCYLKDI